MKVELILPLDCLTKMQTPVSSGNVTKMKPNLPAAHLVPLFCIFSETFLSFEFFFLIAAKYYITVYLRNSSNFKKEMLMKRDWKRWTEEMTLALAGQSKQLSRMHVWKISGARIQLKAPEIFYVPLWDNCLNCPVSVRTILQFIL